MFFRTLFFTSADSFWTLCPVKFLFRSILDWLEHGTFMVSELMYAYTEKQINDS